MISYAGSFTPDYRVEMEDEWKKFTKEKGLPF